MSRKRGEIPLVGIKLNPEAETPLYIQLYRYFRESILSKRIRGGQKLPGTRSLAAALEVSRNTVTLAFEQLMIEGYIEGKTGSGSYVSENIPDHHLPVLENDNDNLRTQSPEINKNYFLDSFNLTRRYISKDMIIPFQSGTPSLVDFPMDLWNKTINNIFKNINPARIRIW